MSHYHYIESKKIMNTQPSFESIIMTALHLADSFNAEKLRMLWPEICEELQQRYDAPGGKLPSEYDE